MATTTRRLVSDASSTASPLRRLLGAALALLLGGCSSVVYNVQDSLKIAQQCRTLEDRKAALLRPSPADFAVQLRARLIAETQCFDRDNATRRLPVLQCAALELERNIKAASAVGADTVQMRALPQLDVVSTEMQKIRRNADALGDALRSGDCLAPGPIDFGVPQAGCYGRLLSVEAAPGTAGVVAGDGQSHALRAMVSIVASMEAIARAIAEVEGALTLVPTSASQARTAVAEETVRFSHTARAFLRNARMTLLGDINATTADTLLSKAIYQQSYRMFDLIDQGLLPIETLLERADQKVYGAVSLSMFLLEDTMRNAATAGFEPFIGGAAGSDPRLLVPFAMAACERRADPKIVRKSPTLQPLLESAFITALDRALEASKDRKPLSEAGLAIRAVSRHGPGAAVGSDTAALGSGPPSNAPGDPETTLGTLVLAEWSMRQATVGITVAPGSDRAGTERRLVAAPPSDEGLVKRLALSASAAQVSAGTAGQTTLYSSASAAAQSMAMANAAAFAVASNTANIQVQGSSTSLFGLKDVPKIEVQVMQQAAAPAAKAPSPDTKVPHDLCAGFPLPGVCQRAGAAFRFTVSPLPEGALGNAAMQQVLEMIAASASAANETYAAEVIGYASSSRFRCRQVDGLKSTGDPAVEVRRTLPATKAGPQQVKIESKAFRQTVACAGPDDVIGGSVALAKARAIWAATVLLGTQASAIRLEASRIAGVGSTFAAAPDKAGDRKVVVQLTPRAGN
jgi:hypothetical protein